MDVQIAEPSAKRNMLIRRQILVAEEHHQVVQQRFMDAFMRCVIERRTEIHTMNLSANPGRQWSNLKLIVTHRPSNLLENQASIESMVPAFEVRYVPKTVSVELQYVSEHEGRQGSA